MGYRKQLTLKRRRENEDCARRLQQARDRFLKSQEYLRQLLKEKEDRKKELLETILRQKELLVNTHREQEDRKKIAVDRAVTDLLERDTQYRLELKKQLDEKMKLAEHNKKVMEENKAHNNATRLQILEHQQRVRKLEK